MGRPGLARSENKTEMFLIQLSYFEKRFWERVKINEGENNCWEWTGTRMKNGYGVLSMGRKNQVLAHRISLSLFNKKPIPDDLFVLHSCDNPKCVNPEHLSLGTAKDNSVDMINKRRHLHGEKHKNSVMTDSMVVEARNLYRSGISPSKISEMTGICVGTLIPAITGITWNHVNNTSPPCERRPRHVDPSKWSRGVLKRLKNIPASKRYLKKATEESEAAHAND